MPCSSRNTDQSRLYTAWLRVGIVLTALLLAACTHYSYGRPQGRIVASRLGDADISRIRQKRIALLGFYGYKIVRHTLPSGQTEVIAELDREQDLKSTMNIGTPIASIPARGLDHSVPRPLQEAFILSYLQHVKETGIPELELVFEARGNSRVLRRRDVDYYVIGVFKPEVQQWAPGCLTAASGAFGILTLGTLPIYETRVAAAVFYVFDNKLRPVQEFQYEWTYSATSAWWMPANNGQTYFTQSESPPLEAWKSGVEVFNQDLALYLLHAR